MAANDAKILQELGNLRGTMEEGFRGVHRRQDVTNGRIQKAEERIEALTTRTSTLESDVEHNTERLTTSASNWAWWKRELVRALLPTVIALVSYLLIASGVLKSA